MKKRKATSKNYIIKTKDGYVAVVEGGAEKKITDKKAIAEIERLLRIRRDAGVELSRLIQDKGLIVGGASDPMLVVGE